MIIVPPGFSDDKMGGFDASDEGHYIAWRWYGVPRRWQTRSLQPLRTRRFTKEDLLLPQKADARGEGAAQASAESWSRMAEGIDDAVDNEWIATSGDIVESAAKGPVVVEEMEAFFELD